MGAPRIWTGGNGGGGGGVTAVVGGGVRPVLQTQMSPATKTNGVRLVRMTRWVRCIT
jgi:hypothetical protein